MAAVVGMVLSAGLVAAQPAPDPAKPAATPGALKAEIIALKPANHVWRAISWQTCPLEALKAAREQNKPIIAWVFLGLPGDERC
jgi:hypothetical protein